VTPVLEEAFAVTLKVPREVACVVIVRVAVVPPASVPTVPVTVVPDTDVVPRLMLDDL
jgi:hypothetical protein